ncbi:helix-turn-helix transcriptional regulator [Acidobacteria bacterium AH-259-A15]|nr:helix-turn-helix transcriptional regulator [Acidobacteria bacterium AH-259-A15]
MQVLKAIRVMYGMNQEELAKKVDRSQSWISRVERGTLIPQREEAEKIADVLAIDLESLISS